MATSNPSSSPERPRSSALRRGRHSESGRIYLLTAVTENRLPIFGCLAAGRILTRELQAADAAGLSTALAFVVMPDHCHWLLELGDLDLSRLAQRIKSRSAIALNRYAGTPGRQVWQRGFHDHALRREEDVRDVARYIVANPVRAGLTGSVGNYSLWDAAWL